MLKEYCFASGKKLVLGANTCVMGILNVTPDSFSDGGRYADILQAVEHMQELVQNGVGIIDIGAESTRPGAKPLSVTEECARILPALAALLPVCPTMEVALKHGVDIINNVGGTFFHGETLSAAATIAAKYDAPLIVTHGGDIDSSASTDIIADIEDFFCRAEKIVVAAGLDAEKNLWLDPGIGFTGKTTTQNLQIIKHLPQLKKNSTHPLVIGASRKRFIGEVLNLPVAEREEGSLAVAAAAALARAAVIRVHDVEKTVRVCKLLDAAANVR